jgi:hypothetical protein
MNAPHPLAADIEFRLTQQRRAIEDMVIDDLTREALLPGGEFDPLEMHNFDEALIEIASRETTSAHMLALIDAFDDQRLKPADAHADLRAAVIKYWVDMARSIVEGRYYIEAEEAKQRAEYDRKFFK